MASEIGNDQASSPGHLPETRWYRRKDGTRLRAEGSLTPLRAADGSLRGFVKILHDVSERQHINEALKAALTRERRITETLQRPLTLSIPTYAFPGMEIVTRYEAALDEALVGGDFFDAFELPKGRLALVVADASGKGLPAAARAIHVKEVLRAFAREYPQSPENIAARLNDYACDMARVDVNGEEAFVTLTLVHLDLKTGEASIVNAGAEPPLLARPGGSGSVLPLPQGLPPGLPLGIVRGEVYHALHVNLAVGDTLVMATDGITEARSDARNQLGSAGLAKLTHGGLFGTPGVATDASDALQGAASHVLAGARAFARGAFLDDVCLMLARRAPVRSSAKPR